ncbi:MAG: cupin domain-containing protein [Campylobacteraceae bacterium]|nr:cupin domain-containing protein [Campylobacteraceae bacterium]
MQNLIKGKNLSLINQIPYRKNQTISKRISLSDEQNIFLFSMYENTDISSELYQEYKIYFILGGVIEIKNSKLSKNELFICEPLSLFDIKAYENSAFLEISVNSKGENMKNLNTGEIISLKNEIDYVEGGISNLDIVSQKGIKIMLMAFDEGQGLSPHSAPGDALVVPLEGKAKVLVGDEEFEVEEDKQIVFPKNIAHNVTAITKFKMMLILVVD